YLEEVWIGYKEVKKTGRGRGVEAWHNAYSSMLNKHRLAYSLVYSFKSDLSFLVYLHDVR
ncbi:unnamed protein product, partial [Brachionus calyciflorus]